jgi:endonuclease YncB( thermonuclease family)
MKRLLLTLLMLPTIVMAQKTPQGVTYDAQIVRVNDGDTVVISAPFLPAPLKPELAVRVFGVDTPEKGHRAQCPRSTTWRAGKCIYQERCEVNQETSSCIILMGQVWRPCVG